MAELEAAEAQVPLPTGGNIRGRSRLNKRLCDIRKRLETKEKLAEEAKRRDIVRRLKESGWEQKTEN